MARLVELSGRQCLKLLETDAVGRIAFSTPMGPRIVPVTYILRDNAIMFRTTAYSKVGTFACDSEVAFEVDDIDIGDHSGQSVVVRGRAEAVEDPRELRAIRDAGEPVPWAGGRRDRYIRIVITELTGHALCS